MNAYTKRKIWRQKVAAIQKSGMVNWATGQWGKGGNNSMTRDMVNGANHRKVG